MFNKIFSIPASASWSFNNSKGNFKAAASSASDFVTHGTNAVSALPELGGQIGTATLAGCTAVVAGAGLCFVSAVFIPAGFAAVALSTVGWGVFTHPLSMIVGANVVALIHNSTAINNFSLNSWGLVKDTASIPAYAAIGITQAAKGFGQIVYNSFDEAVKTIRTPNQQSVDNANGDHIAPIDEKEMDTMFHDAGVEIAFKAIDPIATDEMNVSGNIAAEIAAKAA